MKPIRSEMSNEIQATFENSVRLCLPYPTISYLALATNFKFEEWFNSSAKFINKWRLAMLLIKNEADCKMVESIFDGGILYPIEEEAENDHSCVRR